MTVLTLMATVLPVLAAGPSSVSASVTPSAIANSHASTGLANGTPVSVSVASQAKANAKAGLFV